MRIPRRTPRAIGRPLGAGTPPPLRGRRAHAGPPADEDGAVQADGTETGAGPVVADGPWGLRPRTVRAKIVCLLMVPIVSLLALWGYATVSTAQDVARLRQAQRVDREVRAPIAVAVAALQSERATAVRYATSPVGARRNDLTKLAGQTDRAVAELRLGDRNTVADGVGLPKAVSQRLAAFVSVAEQLRTQRTAVLAHRAGWDETYGAYTATIAKAFAVGGALTGIQDAELGSDARVLLEFSRASEALAQQDALLGGARPTHSLDGERLRRFIGAAGIRRTLTDSAAADLRGSERTAWRGLTAGNAYTTVRGIEDKVLAAPSGGRALAAAPEAAWNDAYTRVQDGMRAIETGAGRDAAQRADPFTRGVLTPAGVAVLFGLAAVAASLVISVRIGRGLVIELVSLRNSALEIARRKLPDAMSKLRAGEEIDIPAELPPGPPTEDETGQVAEALGIVHRAALRAAAERAELASGISGVFVNLARRSQVLVHRQLSLLDSMERRSEDPDELSDLFRLDHLTTRMRRHAESLIILSGAAPGRAWRMPVPLTNVVRAAVSEVEDYARVEVRPLPEASVAGAAVADLTHLMAELVENAAQFSPPHTRVRVTGEPVGNGYVLEVEDRGLGMGRERLSAANRRIEQSEALDLFDSDRLGLFVVSRLAARHAVKVHLKSSPYGGTTAVVLLPTALLHHGPAGPAAPLETPNGHAEPHGHARVPSPRRGDSGPAGQPSEEPNTQPDHAAARQPRKIRPARVTPEYVTEASRLPVQVAGVTALRPHRPLAATTEGDELPRRVRQASLAPQLREQRPDGEGPSPMDDARTPELVRDRMAAYRDGWARGGGRAPGRRTELGSDSSEGDPA